MVASAPRDIMRSCSSSPSRRISRVSSVAARFSSSRPGRVPCWPCWQSSMRVRLSRGVSRLSARRTVTESMCFGCRPWHTSRHALLSTLSSGTHHEWLLSSSVPAMRPICTELTILCTLPASSSHTTRASSRALSTDSRALTRPGTPPHTRPTTLVRSSWTSVRMGATVSISLMRCSLCTMGASTSASQREMPRSEVRPRMTMGRWKRRNSKGFICSMSWWAKLPSGWLSMLRKWRPTWRRLCSAPLLSIVERGSVMKERTMLSSVGRRCCSRKSLVLARPSVEPCWLRFADSKPLLSAARFCAAALGSSVTSDSRPVSNRVQ
mmetsp:Transcript_16488/g.39358  ORF Transcript_16488/g.39358 Transcript_16488/m.39358 type:complete len:323 (+) Transcript_16488:5406-6374(+)